jgi:predicted transglutaminase-like cysteine proteinase
MTQRLWLLAMVFASVGLGVTWTRADDILTYAAREPLIIKGLTKTPIGARQFCQSWPEECRPLEADVGPVPLSEATWHELRAVNDRFNSEVQPRTDAEFYSRREYWTYPDGFGDCEDYALAKRRALMELGWPGATLRLALVRQSNGDAHAVLVAITDLGDFVLDNLEPQVLGWDQTSYHFVKMQTAETLDRWVEVEDDRLLWVASR